ncbi:MAG: 54S ribosomal protein, mitochondrial [Cirrosporium novae-zelandiae]|nr:MAG: 54S ribosomal protein, mitochondrial [Cirrosporium novae-zelandiae]
MPPKSALQPFRVLVQQSNLSRTFFQDPVAQCLVPRLARSMATEIQLPTETANKPPSISNLSLPDQPARRQWVEPKVLTTVYSFPSMEPLRFEQYDANLLHLPLRRDILHRAVIYEGDKTRQGTASTKTRWEVAGSHRKARRQKGSGRARMGTKQSPINTGGGVSHGPHPRDFSTQLPKKVYDLAFRTALSYRYRKGELIVVDGPMNIHVTKTLYLKDILDVHRWGNPNGRSWLVTKKWHHNIFTAMKDAGEDGYVRRFDQVDVKDLLMLGRIVIEKQALDEIFKIHSRDL